MAATPTTSHKHGKDESVEKEYLKKLEELDKKHFEKKVQKKVLQYCSNNVQVAEFLHEHVFFPTYCDDDELSEDCISEEERKYVRQLLEEKEEINKSVVLISKENRDLEKKILNKRLHLRDLMQKRKTAWDKAAKVYESTSKQAPEFEKSDYDMSSGVLSRISAIDLESEDSVDSEYKMVRKQIVEKTNRINELAGILHKLISFSGVKWSDNKHLLEILFCTGNIMESEFDIRHPREFKKIVDDVIHKLSFVKI